jgi:hypothetical protein
MRLVAVSTGFAPFSRVLVIVGLIPFAMTTYASRSAGEVSGSAGQRMFFGETPLQGTIVGHERPLPAELVACANCHPAGSRSALDTAIGPRLDKSTMTDTGWRRGGPPSRFTSTTFCRLLRTGVDPAYIVISRQMPRYDLRDDQCFSLWQYLVGLGDEVRRE